MLRSNSKSLRNHVNYVDLHIFIHICSPICYFFILNVAGLLSISSVADAEQFRIPPITRSRGVNTG